ncbi:hypothetical protein QOZ80_9AG0686290 [Eleusine coracana subsp. coracana]|nr:hypothetical protein QOZ80_9AG0686290 [Eleusine coracana subsp. coracana]
MLCCNRGKKKKKAPAAPRSALKLWDSGIRHPIQAYVSDTDCLDDVSFDSCSRKLHVPRVMLDDSTERNYHNAMAICDSAADDELLREEGVLVHDLAGSDWAVVRLLNRLTRDVAKTNSSKLCEVRRKVEGYCDKSRRVFFYWSWAKLKSTYLSSPWAFITLVVTVFLLATDVTQTSYAFLSYELDKTQARMSRGK